MRSGWIGFQTLKTVVKDMDLYARTARKVRQPLPANPGPRDFVRFATLAANAHNTQPWKFRITGDAVDILPDFARRTPVVDPDDHHLYVSLGCAAENLVIAANANGRAAQVAMQKDARGDSFVTVTLGNGKVVDADLCDAIPKRQSTKSDYDGTPLSAAEVRQLEMAAARGGVDMLLLTDRQKLDEALAFIQAGNTAQMQDPAFLAELKRWIRFSTAMAVRKADGLSGPSAGNPSAPDWLGPILFNLMFRAQSETRKLARHVASSAGLAVFVAETETPEGWITVGRSFERCALTATALGLCHAHLNMPIEVQSVRSDFARWLGMADRRPDLVVRFGRAAQMPMSLRRGVDEVLVS